MRDDLLTAKELASRLKVKPTTIKKWDQSGLIPSVRLTPKVVRYDFDEVVEALQKRAKRKGGSDDR